MPATSSRATTARAAPDGAAPPGAATDASGPTVTPRRSLPGGRAVVGGLLVAVAAVGVVATISGASGGPTTRYVVVARDVAPGTTLTPEDLALSALDLPAPQAARVFTSIGDVTGAVSVGPLSDGELVQAGALADGSDAATPTLALSLPAANADAGELQRGDRVQVLATYGTDARGTTVALADEATVVSASRGDSAVATSDEVLLRLAVTSPTERAAIVNAAVTAEIALVRTTGIDEPGSVARFSPDADLGLAVAPGAGSGADEEEGA